MPIFGHISFARVFSRLGNWEQSHGLFDFSCLFIRLNLLFCLASIFVANFCKFVKKMDYRFMVACMCFIKKLIVCKPPHPFFLSNKCHVFFNPGLLAFLRTIMCLDLL